MSTKSSGPLACSLVALALILPACGGDEAAAPQPASDSAPAEDLQVLERRVGGLERQLRDLRKQIESRRGGDEQSSSDEPGDDTAGDGAPDAAGTAGADAPGPGSTGPTGSGSASGGGSSAGSGGGGGSSSGSGSGGGGGSSSGSGSGGGGGSGSSGGEDGSIEDICGPNPAPEC